MRQNFVTSDFRIWPLLKLILRLRLLPVRAIRGIKPWACLPHTERLSVAARFPRLTVSPSPVLFSGKMKYFFISTYSPIAGDNVEAEKPERPKSEFRDRCYALLDITARLLLGLGLFLLGRLSVTNSQCGRRLSTWCKYSYESHHRVCRHRKTVNLHQRSSTGARQY